MFINKKSGDILKDAEVIERVATIFEKEGSNAWFIRPAQDFLGNKYNAEDFEQNFDTLDVWFESSATYSYVFRNESAKKRADLYIEGSDQHRGWFQHSLLNSCGTFGDAPFKTVMTHGFTVDEQGRKMSKSIGNTVNLEDVIKNYGADIFRLWVTCSDFTQDLKISTGILSRIETVYRKIRNTLRYMLGALNDFDKNLEQVNYVELPIIEKWALHKIVEIDEVLLECIKAYDLNRYFNTVYNFCTGDLSSFYFDVRKDCLYCDAKNDLKRRAYRYVVDILFDCIVKWLAPILPFTCEDAWQAFRNISSVHLERFPKVDSNWKNDDLCNEVEKIQEIRRSVNTALDIARKDKVVGSSLQAKVSLFTEDKVPYANDLEFWKEILIVSDFEIFKDGAPADAFVSEELKNVKVVISPAEGEKCNRCWKVTKINQSGVCDRCQRVLDSIN
ncbi:MAG: class I tRNA ligase family protein [Alphaproteobacteria bacterium]|nr:class I tRNA ligase family protein [Alphaproteobacteria bacterium]